MIKWFLWVLSVKVMGIACLTGVLYLYWNIMNKKLKTAIG